MSEKRYTFKTCSEASGMKISQIKYCASMLRINTHCGISASELALIMEYPTKERKRNRGTLQELQQEMEALK